MGGIVRFSVDHPAIVIALFALIAVALGLLVPKLKFDPSVESMFPEDHPLIKRMDEVEELFGSTESVIVLVKADDIFKKRPLEAVEGLTHDLEDLDGIERVTSLFTVYWISGTEEGIDIHPLVEEVPEDEAKLEELRRVALSDELFVGRIISSDGTTAVISCVPEPGVPDEELYRSVEEIIERYRSAYPDLEFRLTGTSVMKALIGIGMRSDIEKFLPIGIALMLILLYLSFGTVRGVLLPTAAVAFSVTATFGLMALFKQPFTMSCLLIPVSLLAVANDYGIHIVARYYEEAASGGPRREVVYRAAREIGVPITLAGLTTMIGFSSLLSHPMPPSRVAGLFICVGVALAFIFSITFIPASLSLMRLPEVGPAGGRWKWLSRVMGGLGSFSAAHSRLVLLGTVALALAAMSGIPKVRVDTNPVNYFKPEAEIVKATRLANERLAGSVGMSIVVSGDIKSPDTLKRIREVQEWVESLPQVGSTLSIVDYLLRLNKAMHADDPRYYRIPESRDLIAQYLLLYSVSASPEELDRLVDYDYKNAQILVTLKTNSSAEIADVVERIRSYLGGRFGSGDLTMEVSGFAVLFKELMSIIVKAQIRSLIISAFLILLVTSLTFRSLVGGLICAMPFSVALAMVFGMMGYFGVELSIATAMISSVMIGVGVDYTIHFIWRYRSELREGRGMGDALRRTLINTGRAITYNALSVVVGFSVGLVSGFLPIYFFCWLIDTSIVVCYLGALILMPAVLGVLRPKFLFGGVKR